MTKMTKKELITLISDFLMLNPEREIYVPKYQNKLRNGRGGLHAYAICYRCDMVMCRPWAGADYYWDARLERLKKDELLDIAGKCLMSTHP
jgi:hypothetical protein